MAHWTSSIDLENISESIFNAPVQGGKMIGVSDTPISVTIDEIDPPDQRGSFKVRYKNDSDQTITEFIKIKDFQDPSKLNWKFLAFLRAIFFEGANTSKAFKMLAEKDHLFEALLGMSLKIKVSKNDYGYDIDKDPLSGELRIKDAGKGVFADLIKEKVGDKTFDSFESLNTFVDKINEERDDDTPKLRKAYPNISSTMPIDEETANGNFKALHAAYNSTSSAVTVGGTLGGAKIGGGIAQLAKATK